MQPNDGRVVSNFIIQALKGESITIYGDVTQTRSFQYVDDLIEPAKKELDWVPKIPLEKGLVKTIDYFASII